MSNASSGNHFCISTPHHKSSMLGMQEYLISRDIASAALKSVISLTYNLPHLCGLGGDAIIIEKSSGNITFLNGTGKTGTHQHYESYKNKGLATVPRRGIYSTMVYGCPSAYDRFATTHNVELERIFKSLVDNDFANGIIRTPELAKSYSNAEKELHLTKNFKNWSNFFVDGGSVEECFVNTVKAIAANGFGSFYSGALGHKVYESIRRVDDKLYEEQEFSDFLPNIAETKNINFLNASITAHGSNSPWRQLFLILKIYERSAGSLTPLPPLDICTAAGIVDHIATSSGNNRFDCEEAITNKAKEIYENLAGAAPVAHANKQSHTIFMACAEASGKIIGITNSIFTPFGSLFEVDRTSVILSNRCFSFNGEYFASNFQSGVPAKHTNNCVFVETDDLEFVIGTSGGPVQSQTLAFIINKIVHCGDTVRNAIASPRYANMGINSKTNRLTYLSETYIEGEDIFVFTGGLSDKLGIVQLAGINKKTGETFSVADPRGDGIALGI